MAQCTATSRSGNQCKRHAHPGAVVCVMHGAGAPQVRRAAEKRLAVTRAMDEAGQLIAALGGIVPEDADANATILEAVATSRAMAAVFRDLVAGLNVNPTVPDGPVGLVGVDHQGDLTAHPYLDLLRVWTAEAAKQSKLALDAGIDERRLQVEEDKLTLMAAAFRMFAANVINELIAGGLPAAQVHALVGDRVPALMRAALESVEHGGVAVAPA